MPQNLEGLPGSRQGKLTNKGNKKKERKYGNVGSVIFIIFSLVFIVSRLPWIISIIYINWSKICHYIYPFHILH